MRFNIEEFDPKWNKHKDLPNQDKRILREATDNLAYKTSEADGLIMEDALNTDELRNYSRFLTDKIKNTNNSKLKNLFYKTLNLINDRIELDRIYNMNTSIISKEIPVHKVKKESDKEMINNIEIERRKINKSMTELGKLIKMEFPEEFEELIEYIQNAENRTN